MFVVLHEPPNTYGCCFTGTPDAFIGRHKKLRVPLPNGFELGPELDGYWSFRYTRMQRDESAHGYIEMPGGKAFALVKNPVADLLTCEKCGRFGTERRVRRRFVIFSARLKRNRDLNMLDEAVMCFRCWGISRREASRRFDAEANDLLLNKLEKVIRDEKANTHNR